LWLLNIALAAVLVLLGHVLRQRWQEAHLREDSVLGAKIAPAPPPSMPPRPVVPKLQPTSYADVAEKVLFSRDRNPDVIPDVHPPPPPPPVPPFPVAHGVMIWDGVPPTVILSVGKADQQTYRAGDKVGEFEIASITDRQIVFTWDGKTFVKNISDLETADVAPAAANQAQPAKAPPEAGAPAPPPPQVVQTGPGQNIGKDGKMRTCDQNDPSPVGAIVDGYRKVAVPSPLAPNAHFCRWDAVN
jgi:hypothetical protein